jgi:ABC-type protease/lipase transport system fused ATPase/permease subunit
VVLDEPNANLDGAGEEALVAAIKRAKQAGCTVILITHKPSLLFVVDKVLVINDGMVEAFGERNAVLPKIMPPAPTRAVAPAVAQVKAPPAPASAEVKSG